MYHHLFAIVERLPASWRAPATALGAVEARTVGRFRLISSVCDRPPEPNARTLAGHHDVIASTLEATAVLPFRFGTLVPETELAGWLGAHASRIDAALRTLRDYVEMTVKLLRLHCGHGLEQACPECADGTPGATELRRLADRLVERAGVARWRLRPSSNGGTAVASVAFLVPRHEVHAFLARIAPVASRATGIAVVPSGPWPASSFVEALDRQPLTRMAPALPRRERRQG